MQKYWLNFKYAIKLGKPLLIFRLIKTYLGIIFFKNRPLRYVDFAIGYSCNLKCEHCFATALEDGIMRRGIPLNSNKDSRKMLPRGGVGRKKLTPKDYGEMVEEAMQLGACNFSFQGGEPTLYPDLIEYIKEAHPEKNVISVTTNGTLLNESKILELKQVGVDILTISLDSADPSIHDSFRGIEGTFNKTLATIKMAKKLGKINKAAKGGDPYDHFAKAWADEEKSRRGVNGPFYVDEVMADAKVLGQEKNIGKYFKKNTRMPSTTEPMDPTATATCLSK